jgi:hypothetical protein
VLNSERSDKIRRAILRGGRGVGERNGKGDVLYIHTRMYIWGWVCVYEQRTEGSLGWTNTPRVVNRRKTIFIHSRGYRIVEKSSCTEKHEVSVPSLL